MLSKRIDEFLKKQHIHVPDDWIDACLEWLQNENDVNFSSILEFITLYFSS